MPPTTLRPPPRAPTTVTIALLAGYAGCARSHDQGAEGITCGEASCASGAQFCAWCDGPDDDGAYEPLCIDVPDSIPDWWGAWYPGCDRPIAVFDCLDSAQCGRGSTCVASERATFCLDDGEADLCDTGHGLMAVCRTVGDCPACAGACERAIPDWPHPDWPVGVCVPRTGGST